MVGTYLIKAVDFAGNESETAASIITNIVRILGLNVVETFEQEHPTWAGTGTNAVVDAGMGGIIISNLTVGDGIYRFNGYVDLGAVYTSRLTAALYISGQDITSDLYDFADLYAAGNLYGAQEGQYDVQLELGHTQGDPGGAGVFSDWEQFLVADYSARAYRFRVTLQSFAENITPILKKVSIEVDMPDRIVEFTQAVGTGGATITFDPEFYEKPEIGLSVINGQEGDAYTITSHTSAGFTIAFTNSGSPVARTVSGIAKSYGEKST
jgi:hypothetical protein